MEKEIWISAAWNKYSKEFEYHITTWEPSQDSGRVVLEKRTLEFESPNDAALRGQMALALRLKLRALRVAHAQEETEAEEEVRELLALPSEITA